MNRKVIMKHQIDHFLKLIANHYDRIISYIYADFGLRAKNIKIEKVVKMIIYSRFT